jgi:hypothetical protein
MALWSGLSAFGQGFATFGGFPNTVVDQTFLPPNPANFKVSFLWGIGTPMITSIATSTPTNSPLAFDRASAWNLVLNDPNFQLAIDLPSNLTVVADVIANGSWFYRTNGAFPVLSAVAGATNTVFVIGWDDHYDTPQLAAAAAAPIGWSKSFSYVFTFGGSMASRIVPFGVPVPEPTTAGLTATGLATVLVRRRRRNQFLN